MKTLLEDEADYVVVGTGAGGATAARVLAGAGRSVVLLEEGPDWPAADRARRPFLDIMAGAFRDAGGVAALGRAPIPIIQGRLVGGSTAINSGIIWRLPEHVRREWVEGFGLADLLDEAELERVFETIEKELGVERTPEAVLGGNSRRLAAGAKALGLPGEPTLRNAPGCRGSAMCLNGCPTGQKHSMDVSYIPKAAAAGARLHPLAKARRVIVQGGRAREVAGEVLDPATRRPRGAFRARARKGIIVAGGAVQTPILLRRSGFKGLVGERFQAHPGSGIVARFKERVGMVFGATQGYQIPLPERRLKIESLALPPEMLASRVPGAGAPWQERLADLDRLSHWVAVPRMKALGSVRAGWPDEALIRYSPLAEDYETLRAGVALACRLAFAAGAVEVYPGMPKRPAVLRDASEVKALEEGKVGPGDFHLVGTHLFGTACAGADPSRSAVTPELALRGAEGLYVMDASVCPTNTGVNPQHTIMALTWRAAEKLT